MTLATKAFLENGIAVVSNETFFKSGGSSRFKLNTLGQIDLLSTNKIINIIRINIIIIIIINYYKNDKFIFQNLINVYN